MARKMIHLEILILVDQDQLSKGLKNKRRITSFEEFSSIKSFYQSKVFKHVPLQGYILEPITSSKF